jgi:pimeloyl-ACP methyl ester carboxylesterase
MREARETFVTAGGLVGWLTGAGPEVLLLHGGPGLSDYMDLLLPELDGFRVASFQQRGVEPSPTEGPYDVPTSVADVVEVLDELGWQAPVVIGHSWGGHLLLHLLAAVPERVGAALVVDPLGGVGDGGMERFGAEMAARVPEHLRAHAKELDDAMMAGEGTQADALASMTLYWPSYFADRDHVMPMPALRFGLPVSRGMWPSITAELPGLAARLQGCPTPTRFVHGERSPMPVTASTDTAAVLRAEVDVVPGAGHFTWFERPGCVRTGLERLLASRVST